MSDHAVSRRARTALGIVRLLNGGLGLLLPKVLIHRLDPADPPSPAAVYAFRLFGIRTILLGRDLLVCDNADLRRTLDEAVLIHVTDTVTATSLTASGSVPRRSGLVLMAVSAGNTALALLARRER